MKPVSELNRETKRSQLLAEIRMRESNVDLHSHNGGKPCQCDFCWKMRREIQSLHKLLGDYATLYDLADKVGQAVAVNVYGRW